MIKARRGDSVRWLASCGITACLVVATSACGVFDAPPPVPTQSGASSNILVNPGFEEGGPPWIPSTIPPSDAPPVSLSDDRPHGGDRSAELKLDAATGEGGTRAVSSVQGTAPAEFPEFVSGFYRITDWQPRATFQYVYFTVTVHGGDFGNGAPAHEIRFVIGAAIEPSLEPDVQYVFLSRNPPALGRWTYFSYPVRQAFADRFQHVPARWTSVDIGIGVRLDGRDVQDAPASADVQYDDLYAGPQSANPNRPADP